MDTVNYRYAESLFELAKEENCVEVYRDDMQKIQEVFKDESLVKFFSHVSLKDEIKVDVLNKSFKGQVSPYVFNFLLLLIKKRRINYICGICKAFQSLCNVYFGIKEGILYTAFMIDDKQKVEIEKAVSKKLASNVQLRVVIDEKLIGGIRVEVDNHVFDDSLSAKLEGLKKELLRK